MFLPYEVSGLMGALGGMKEIFKHVDEAPVAPRR